MKKENTSIRGGSGLIEFNPVLTVRTRDGRLAPVKRYYREGSFVIHRSIRRRGWTITHWNTRDSVVQRVPRLWVARAWAKELDTLSPKWKGFRRRYKLSEDLNAQMNRRELYALCCLLVRWRDRFGILW